jgi:hypothetical protein
MLGTDSSNHPKFEFSREFLENFRRDPNRAIKLAAARRRLGTDTFKKWSGADQENIEANQEQRNQGVAESQRNPIHSSRSPRLSSCHAERRDVVRQHIGRP